MTKKTGQRESSDPKLNLLLAKLDPEDYEALIALGKVVSFRLRKQVFRQDQAIDAVYFPLTCMASLIVGTDSRPQMEMATAGREGAIGTEVCQAEGCLAIVIIQLEGTALRIPAKMFLKEVAERPELRKLMDRYLYVQTRQILYAASCNRVHSMEERSARWVLMTHDRAGQDTFPLTQEFLSHMLGVRRATVNVATGMLKKAGFINYVRGYMTVLDRAGLESAACSCYGAINNVYKSSLDIR